METQNQRGQTVIELVLILVLFISLLKAVTMMAQQQQKISNQTKISQGKNYGTEK